MATREEMLETREAWRRIAKAMQEWQRENGKKVASDEAVKEAVESIMRRKYGTEAEAILSEEN